MIIPEIEISLSFQGDLSAATGGEVLDSLSLCRLTNCQRFFYRNCSMIAPDCNTSLTLFTRRHHI